MPRRARLRLAGHPFHLYNRGVNRSACFQDPEDYRRFLGLLQEASLESGCAIHAYALMTNHIHLLVTPSDAEAFSSMMKRVAQCHAQACNKRWGRSGPLWEGRYKACLVRGHDYELTCQRYIELNPVRARMVSHPAEYPWSSHRANAFGLPDPLLSPSIAFRSLAEDEAERRIVYRGMFDEPVDPDALQRIRAATNGGFVLGARSATGQLEERLGQRVSRLRRRAPTRGA